MSELYVGLMSGTSIDSIDAVLADLATPAPSILHACSSSIDDPLKQELVKLCLPANNEIDRMGAADLALGETFAAATLALLKQAKVAPSEVKAIGSHGQTIRHRPADATAKSRGFTLQIGDPNTIAELTGITTVADFRRRDMAAGGQGAPLVPAFHREVFASSLASELGKDVVVINIGGIANISLLQAGGKVLGFDTGPGNRLMDDWVRRHQNLDFDAQGQWARSGNVINELLQQLLQHDFFQLPAPKSTGREDFNLAWLEQQLASFGDNDNSPAAADVQATLAEFTAITITNAINTATSQLYCVYICGGGAQNAYLLQRLQQMLAPAIVATTMELGIDPQWVEATAFAWLAKQTLSQQPGNLPAVTGAGGERILGGIYYA